MKTEIIYALKKLGINCERIKLKTSYGRAIVYVENKYFGIYDFEKNTFVD